MAPRMKIWVGLTLFGVGLVAVFLLPPRPPSIRSLDNPQSLDRMARELEVELDQKVALLKRIRWNDSLPQHVVGSAREGLAVAGPGFDSDQDGTLADFRSLVARELEGFDRRDPDMVFGYVHQDVTHGGIPGLEVGVRGSRVKETLTGVHDGTPYCLQVRIVTPEGWAEDFARSTADAKERVEHPANRDRTNLSNYAGVCKNHIRFGAPGPHIQEWLSDGAYGFMTRQATAENRMFDQLYARRRAFAVGRANSDVIEGDLCATGDRTACLAAVTDPHLMQIDGRPLPQSPVAYFERSTWDSAFGRLDDYLLSDLELEFGADKVQEFWRSEEPVPDAFEATFGIDMAEWTHQWIVGAAGERVRGPLLPRSDLFLALLSVSAMGLIATGWSATRKVT